jgi:hypothetical protein
LSLREALALLSEDTSSEDADTEETSGIGSDGGESEDADQGQASESTSQNGDGTATQERPRRKRAGKEEPEPVYCDRCTRLRDYGMEPVKDCVQCAEARKQSKQRETGGHKESDQAKSKNGQELYRWKDFDGLFHKLVQEPVKLYERFRLVDHRGATRRDDDFDEMDRHLTQFEQVFRRRYEELSGNKAPTRG